MLVFFLKNESLNKKVTKEKFYRKLEL